MRCRCSSLSLVCVLAIPEKKAAKLAEKLAKAESKGGAPGPTKPKTDAAPKAKKVKAEEVVEPPFVNTTPKGDKKGEPYLIRLEARAKGGEGR